MMNAVKKGWQQTSTRSSRYHQVGVDQLMSDDELAEFLSEHDLSGQEISDLRNKKATE